MPWFWGINGAAGVLAASVAVVTSIAFSIDTTLKDRSCLLSLGRCSSRIVGVGSRAIQPYCTTIPAPTQKREWVDEYWTTRRSSTRLSPTWWNQSTGR
jgi:hypothetical protein